MVESDNLRYTRIALNNGSGAIPALGFGTLIPDPLATRTATKAALEVGFRQLDASERYRNEKDVGEAMQEVFKAGRIKPAVVHVESHPYLPQWDLLDYCRKNGIVLQAFAALGHGSEPKLLEDPVITAIARRVNKTPAQVLLAWAIQRGTALLTTSKTPSRIKENFEVSTLPEEAVREISEGIKSRVRFNTVVETSVPGFIPRG